MGKLFCEGCLKDLDSASDYKDVIVNGKPRRIGVDCCA